MYKRGHGHKGLWISLEAGEGAGKGTHLRLLAQYLSSRGFYVEQGREPGTTPAGEEIRKVLQHPDVTHLNTRTELLLYVAAGIEFFEEKIKPVIAKGGIFIADRWRDSTKAYQGYGLGIDLSVIDALTKFSCDKAYPDMTFLIDVDPKVGLAKVSGYEFVGKDGAAKKLDKIEARGIEYHTKVNNGYKEMAKKEPERFKVIPYADGNVDAMQAHIREHVDAFIAQHQLENALLKAKTA